MSPLTIFLAKLLGLYCIIVALAMMTRKQSAVATVKALIANQPLLLLVEVIGLATGLAMILGHNVWSGGPLPVVVTLVGWLMAIRGAGLLALSPSATMKLFDGGSLRGIAGEPQRRMPLTSGVLAEAPQYALLSARTAQSPKLSGAERT
jgi:hypothetical protein